MTLHLLRTRGATPDPALIGPKDRSLVLDETPAEAVLDAILAAARVLVW